MAVLAIVLAILAPIFAQLIYFAISRRREYLADAGAARLTRYPEGLASALEVLAGDTHRLAKANKATAPMYIVNPMHEEGAMALNATAPADARCSRAAASRRSSVTVHLAARPVAQPARARPG